jgi:RNA polymerase sigma factor (sigma-70 family)
MVLAESNLAGAPSGEDVTDEVLLERFMSQWDEAAFAVLVRRHGPLVLSVCRRVLHHEQDAEDAFQAVFCVLARKAGSIRKRGAVAGWLHAVAHRIARRLRDQRGRRPMPAPNLPDIPVVEDSPEWIWRELRPVLDEEVNRLPEKYRLAFVLCYLQGRTNEQAAVQLGCPLGTVLSRLARARDRLRGRLKRRALALSVGALSTGALATARRSEAAGAIVRPELAQAALQAAVASTGATTAAGTPSPNV